MGGDNNRLAVDTYDKIAGIYAKQYFNDLSDTPWIDRFLRYLPAGAKILDVGCGPGEFTKYLLDKGYDAIGIDLSEAMVKIARERVSSEHFATMDMRHLEYKPSTFDGLLAAYSLIHIPSGKIAGTLQELHRVLKPGGYMLAITQQGEPDKVVDEPLMQGEKMFINFFTEQRIAAALHDAGFGIVYQEELAAEDPGALSDRIIYTIGQRS